MRNLIFPSGRLHGSHNCEGMHRLLSTCQCVQLNLEMQYHKQLSAVPSQREPIAGNCNTHCRLRWSWSVGHGLIYRCKVCLTWVTSSDLSHLVRFRRQFRLELGDNLGSAFLGSGTAVALTGLIYQKNGLSRYHSGALGIHGFARKN